MKREVGASICVAAAVMLGACASKESVKPGSVDASTTEATSAEYQRIAENATRQISCKKQTVLGSRVPIVLCVSEADLKAQREHTDQVMHDLHANEPMNRQPLPPPPPTPR